ncbi:hypothetical protein [Ruegeria lacuscaerulensis]|uniref:hypothetical protein n=1 Tax=Ruegeria lacuscaerulensis TaxID=55218 RepID=UPI001479FDCA|nr:hypothetical protein [Ruegeria lacuscaerulensis]
MFVPVEVSAEASDNALDVLTSGRASVVATARVGFSVKETQVRYYHPGDAEEAMLAAGALGGISRDFTNSATKTRPGRLEVYLAGNGASSGQKRNLRGQPNQFDVFIARLLDELR